MQKSERVLLCPWMSIDPQVETVVEVDRTPIVAQIL